MADKRTSPEHDPIARNVKAQLDDQIVNIELTLISIIQAIPLAILADKLIAPMLSTDWPVLLYVGIGLLTIFLFWSRALIHTLSFIGWPLDFTHNFLYIFSTLVQSVVVTQVANPRVWFGLWAIYTFVLWGMYTVDLRMIRRQHDQESTDNGRTLLQDVYDDQLLNVKYYIPAGFLYSAVSYLCIVQWPEIFIAQQWHLLLAALQFIFGAVYLGESYVILKRRNVRILKRNVDAVE